MAIGIGLRVHSGSQVYFCIIEKDAGVTRFLSLDSLRVPLSLDKPEQLGFVRNTLMDIFEMYNVTQAAIRIPEFAKQAVRQTTIDRHYLEGVIQESIAGSKIEKHVAARIGTLNRLLGFPRSSDFWEYAHNEQSFTEIPGNIVWADLSLEERESILACYAALGL